MPSSIQRPDPNKDECMATCSKEQPTRAELIKPTTKRYLIQFLLFLVLANRTFHWMQVGSATRKIAHYYDVDNHVINGASVVFFLASSTLSWPSCIINERIGLRRSILVASFGTAIGAILKCFSCQPDRVGIILLAQATVAVSSQLVYSMPSRLASVWFPDHQVSSAVGFSMQGIELGIAVGFMAPQVLLREAGSREDIGHSLQLLFDGTAIISVATFFACWLFFDEAPKYAPGVARHKQICVEEAEESEKLRQNSSLKKDLAHLVGQLAEFLRNRQLVILWISYGLNIGTMNALDSLWNQLLEPISPDDDLFIGYTGLAVIFSGILGSILWGRLLDSSHKFRLVSIILCLSNLIAVTALSYAICFTTSKLFTFVAASVMGAFQTGILVAGMELAVEFTYPAPELVTASFMNLAPQSFTCVSVFIASLIMDNYGILTAQFYILSCYGVGFVLIVCVKEELRRQNAVKENLQITSVGQSTKKIDRISPS